jgi:nitrate reductase alpha subunit
MVTGQQTLDFDLCAIEHSKLALVWGMNWTCTKMPDAHWMTEARMKGTKIVVIACEYSATSNKADEVLIVRPGTTPALALGLAQVIIAEKLYDVKEVACTTDLPLLVRMDTGKMLRASDVFPGYQPPVLGNGVTMLKPGQAPPPPRQQSTALLSEEKRRQWDDAVMWDAAANKPVATTRDQFGKFFLDAKIDPALEGSWSIKLVDGATVECRTVMSVTRQMLDDSYTPVQVEKLTWAPADAIRKLARDIAAHPEATQFIMGMGPNQFFNNDLKDRAVFLVAALTRNIGRLGGNVGSFAGNYRAAFFSGMPTYAMEDPFQPQLDPAGPVKVKRYYGLESVHYFNHGDTILRAGKHSLTGKTHLPTPTKSIMVSNSNSLIGNVKGHYDVVVNTMRRVEFFGISEWWWTTSCEYADVVFPVDSWAEFKCPDVTISVTNPFLYVFPATPLPRIHDTRGDIEVLEGLCKAIGRQTDDTRYDAYWKFVKEGSARHYIQRVLDHSNSTRGYRIEEIEAKAAQGVPVILQTRTYPKFGGYEQVSESRPWYTRTGRLEFYRDEDEFIDSGENLIVHREPIDSTFYEPNVIVARAHPLLRPKTPADYGVDPADLSGDRRQHRHVIRTVEELLRTEHPLIKDGHRFLFHTPKYRHGSHTTPIDVDIIAVWFGPFGDMRRLDKRMPGVSEMYVDMHPLDGKAVGVEDGDYVWIDADPKDRPFHGWQQNPKWYKVARLLARARYYPGTPRGVTRMWHNAYAATYSSVLAAAQDPTGLAKSPATGYQALFRSGSHQSCTRGYLKPTMMTDSLNVKELLSQVITQGFVPDVHCPTGAPREAMVKITRAEAGGLNGQGLWRAARLGFRPTYESPALLQFIRGQYAARV